MTGNQNAPSLTNATRRLSSALERLEKNLQEKSIENGHTERQDQHLSLVVSENDALRGEHDRLNEALNGLQTQYDDLQKVAVNIYGKLDDSVRRISKIIGS